jgi:hypothetical protein
MKNTTKIMEGLVVGMIIGGTAGAIIISKLSRGGGDSRKRFTHAVKSACGFIEDICG